MKVAIVLVAAFFTSLLFLGVNTSDAFAQSTPAIPSVSMQFAGVFTNTQVNVSGQITIDLTINDDNTLEGTVDFTQFSNGQFTCGSGAFTGTKTDEQVELTFTSDSVDPACGFYQGVSFTIEAALLNNTIIRGDYSTDTGQEGIVELRRIFTEIGVYIPYIKFEENE